MGPSIKGLDAADAAALSLSDVAQPEAEPLSTKGTARNVDEALVRELVRDHHRFIWRLLGRLGVPEADLDDAAQQVFLVLTRPDLEILLGSERAFLFGVALKVARSHKRSLARRRESNAEPVDTIDAGLSPEQLAERHQARRLLDELLERMPMDLRIPFVLFELDDVSTSEIAMLLEIPGGTVASRLRRAREWFRAEVERLQGAQRTQEGA